VPRTRGSSAGRKPTVGSRSRLASRLHEPHVVLHGHRDAAPNGRSDEFRPLRRRRLRDVCV
jgi:hypothetical protein